MSSEIKQTPEFKRLWKKYGGKRDLTRFLSDWLDWSTYRHWQELEGIRESYDFGGENN